MACLKTIEFHTRDAEAKNSSARLAQIAPRVLLADDQQEIRHTVASMLEADFEIVGLAENGKQVLELVVKRSPDVLVLDIFMPVLNGIDTAAWIKASGSLIKVVFLTVHEDPDFIDTAISLGVLGYVLKPHLATDLIPAIRSALRGHLYISPSVRLS